MFMFALVCWGCADKNDEPKGTSINDINAVLTVPEGQVFTTSATVDLKVVGAVDFAYKVVEGANPAKVDGAIIYSEAQEKVDGIIKVEGESQKVNIYGLEGNKDYTIFFAFRADDGYKVESVSIKTPVYTQPLTIVDANMFKVTFHVEVPEDTYYKVTLISTENYKTQELNFGYKDFNYMADGDFFGDMNGLPAPQFKGPQTITFENGKSVYRGAYNEQKVLDWGNSGSSSVEEEDLLTIINPGTSYQLLIWECPENGDISEYMFGEMSLKSEEAKSRAVNNPESPAAPTAPFLSGEMVTTAEMVMGDQVIGEYPKMFMRQGFFTQMPAPGNGEVKIEKVLAREKTLIMRMTPDKGVYKMKYNLIEQGEHLDEIYQFIDGERGIEAMIFSGGFEASKTEEAAFDVEVGKKYTLYVSAIYNSDATIRSLFKMADIEIPKSTKPKSELVVTPLESKDCFVVAYNVKAPNKDCYAFRYLMNYTSEWWPMINGMDADGKEAKLEQMLGQYGTIVNEDNGADILRQINSDEGYTLGFTSQDDKESWLVLMSYNEDESTKLFYDGPNYKVRSGKLEPKEPVKEEYLNRLVGTWTGKLKRPGETGLTSEFDVTIGREPIGKTTTLPDDKKQELIKYFEEQGNSNPAAEVDKLWAEYLESQSKYAEKYKGQNWLVATGFCYDSHTTKLASPFDLFCNTKYTSYDTDELFQDYGPKLFFEIGQDGSITLVSSEMDEENYYVTYIDPFEAWNKRISLFGYNEDYSTDFSQYNFPCELSEDGNTLTIKPYVINGFKFTPSFAQEVNLGAFSWNCIVEDCIVLTRKAGETASRSVYNHVSDDFEVSPLKGNGLMRRTRLPKADVFKSLEIHKPFSLNNK